MAHEELLQLLRGHLGAVHSQAPPRAWGRAGWGCIFLILPRSVSCSGEL